MALKNLLTDTLVTFIVVFIGTLIGSNILSLVSKQTFISFINILYSAKLIGKSSILVSLLANFLFRKEIAKEAFKLPSKENLNEYKTLKNTLKEHYLSRDIALQNKPVKRDESLALIKPQEKNIAKKEEREPDIISNLIDEFNKIIAMDNPLDVRLKFVELANSLPTKLSKEDNKTVNKAATLVGEYFLIAAKMPDMLVKTLLYYLNSAYYKYIIKALEKELNNIVDDVDTIINVTNLISDKANHTNFVYMNRLLDLYLDYNSKNKDQTRIRK